MKTTIQLVCLATLLCALTATAFGDQNTSIVYLRSSAAPPWDVTSNEVDMDDVFGSGNWSSLFYETANTGTLFSSSTRFIFMEGGDNNANALQSFLSNNSATIASWVNSGGRLFINAAPNQGNGMDLGFGVTLNFDPVNYTSGSNNGVAANSGHPIFKGPSKPVGTTFSGGDSFSHAYLTGTGISAILQDDQSRTVLAEMDLGSGVVVFGGLTADVFQAPWPAAHYLRENIIYYVATYGQ